MKLTKKDRALLEMAAKAAGLLVNPTRISKGGLWVVSPDAKCQSEQNYWNPLVFKDDAFDLQVRLTMMVDFIQTSVPSSLWYGHVVAVSKAGSFYEPGFSEVSTCRAITRAAAAVGEQMP